MRNGLLVFNLGFLLLLIEHHNFNLIFHLRVLLVYIYVLGDNVLNAITQIAAHCIVRYWLNSLSLRPKVEFIEGKYSLSHRRYVAWRDLDLYILNLSDYRLIFTALDTLQRPYHTQQVHLLLIFSNRMVCRIVMLLIAEQNVVEQRALRGKEANSDF